MGTPYLTAVGSPPDPRSRAWLRWYRRLVDFRLRECDVTRATNYYVSPTGNDGNAGSIGSPWLTLGRALTAYAASAGNIGIWFEKGGVYRSATGITVNKPNSTWGAYGTGANPIITNWTQTVTGGWSDAGGSGRWYRSYANEIAWITDSANRDSPMRHVADFATVTSTPWSWTYDVATHTIHINPGVGVNPNSPAKTFEFCDVALCEDDGIEILTAGDGSLIQDLDCYGWGAGYGVGGIGSTQHYGIRAHMTGTACCVVRRCKSKYSGRHGMGQQGGGGSAGISTWLDCETGYFNDTANLGVNAFISYHDGSGQETIFDGCTDSAGPLPWESFAGGAKKDCSHFYCHNGGGTVSLIVTHNSQTTKDATKTNYSFGGGWSNIHENDAPGTDSDPSTYRVFFSRPRIVHEDECKIDFCKCVALINPTYRIVIPSGNTDAGLFIASSFSGGIVVNGIVGIRDAQVDLGVARYITKASGSSTTRFYHTAFFLYALEAGAAGFGRAWKFNDNVGTVTLRSCLLVRTGTRELWAGVGNSSARVSNVARYQVQESGSSGIDQGPNGIVLPSIVVPGVGFDGGGIGADGVEFDQFDNPRPATPSIGPVELRPLKQFVGRVA